jgi:hypothetical protein
MSTIQLANLSFESTGGNRAYYDGNPNTFNLSIGNNKILYCTSNSIVVNGTVTSVNTAVYAKTGNYTLTNTDHASFITVSNTTSANISIAYAPVGFTCTVYKIGTGNVNFVGATSDISISTRNSIAVLSQTWGGVSIYCVEPLTFIIDGALDAWIPMDFMIVAGGGGGGGGAQIYNQTNYGQSGAVGGAVTGSFTLAVTNSVYVSVGGGGGGGYNPPTGSGAPGGAGGGSPFGPGGAGGYANPGPGGPYYGGGGGGGGGSTALTIDSAGGAILAAAGGGAGGNGNSPGSYDTYVSNGGGVQTKGNTGVYSGGTGGTGTPSSSGSSTAGGGGGGGGRYGGLGCDNAGAVGPSGGQNYVNTSLVTNGNTFIGANGSYTTANTNGLAVTGAENFGYGNNYANGGGSSTTVSGYAPSGKDGIAFIRYAGTKQVLSGGSVSSVNGYVVHTITTSTNLTFI